MFERAPGLMLGIEKILRTIAAFSLLAVMMIIFCDVFARYLFNAPLLWSYDLIGMYLMPVLFYFALSDTQADRHHIAVDLLRPKIPPRMQRVIDIVGSLLTALLFAYIVQIFAVSCLDNLRSQAVVMGSHEWPTWIPDLIVVIGVTAITLRLLGQVVGHTVSLITGKPLIALPGLLEK